MKVFAKNRSYKSTAYKRLKLLTLFFNLLYLIALLFSESLHNHPLIPFCNTCNDSSSHEMESIQYSDVSFSGKKSECIACQFNIIYNSLEINLVSPLSVFLSEQCIILPNNSIKKIDSSSIFLVRAPPLENTTYLF